LPKARNDKSVSFQPARERFDSLLVGIQVVILHPNFTYSSKVDR
jgi:hypothetical protein